MLIISIFAAKKGRAQKKRAQKKKKIVCRSETFKQDLLAKCFKKPHCNKKFFKIDFEHSLTEGNDLELICTTCDASISGFLNVSSNFIKHLRVNIFFNYYFIHLFL